MMSLTDLSKVKAILSKNAKPLIYSFIIILNHFAFGISNNIVGAVMVDLRHIYGVSINTISYVQVATSAGYVLGSLIGWLYKWLNRQLTLVGVVLLKALTIALVPHYPNFPSALGALVLFGICIGSWDASSGYWLIELWPEKGNAIALMLQQFAYGIGAITAALLAAPYVRGEATLSDAMNITTQERIDLLTVPFAVNGAVHLIAPILLLFFYFTYRYHSPPPATRRRLTRRFSLAELPPITTPKKLLIPHRKLKLALVGITLAFYLSSELGWFNFSASLFQYIELKLDATSATRSQSILSAAYTVGRLLTAFLTLKLTPDIIITYHYAIIASGLVTLLLGRNSQTIIYIGSAILGYGYSAMLPAIFTFAQRHLGLSARINSVLAFMAGLLSLVTPLVMGLSFHTHPMMLFVIEGVFLGVSACAFVLVRIWITIDGLK